MLPHQHLCTKSQETAKRSVVKIIDTESGKEKGIQRSKHLAYPQLNKSWMIVTYISSLAFPTAKKVIRVLTTKSLSSLRDRLRLLLLNHR
jgi:hypothetical protein